MSRIGVFGILGFLLYFCCYVCATLTIKQIIGPESVEDGSMDDLVLDCDFEADGEEEVVLKWFFNGLEDQIYQWITRANHSYARGPLKNLIDVNYKVSNDPNTMLRALKFKDVSPALSGNYTCKVSSEASDVFLTKQVIVYSPATSFDIFLIGGDDEFEGDEVVLCDVVHVSPKPSFDLYVAGLNGSVMDLPEMFVPSKRETLDENGFYNISVTLSFNASYLEEGTTKFVCQLGIPGTNYSETKSVEYVVESKNDTQSSEFFYEDYSSNLNSTSSHNSTEETNFQENGKLHLQSSILTIVLLLFCLLLVT